MAIPKFLLKTKTMIIISLIIFTIGTYSAFSFQTSLGDIALSPGTNLPGNGPFYITIISLAAFLIFQIFFILGIKKSFTSLTESNEEIRSSVASLKGAETDEIKELVMTRNVLLEKLESNKKSLQKAKHKIKN